GRQGPHRADGSPVRAALVSGIRARHGPPGRRLAMCCVPYGGWQPVAVSLCSARTPRRSRRGKRAAPIGDLIEMQDMTGEKKAAAAKPVFQWDDPLLLEAQLTEEERMVRDTARAYAQEKLLP